MAGLNPGYGVRTASTPSHQDRFQWSPYSSLKKLEGCVVPSTLSIREGEAMRRCRCYVDELVLLKAHGPKRSKSICLASRDRTEAGRLDSRERLKVVPWTPFPCAIPLRARDRWFCLAPPPLAVAALTRLQDSSPRPAEFQNEVAKSGRPSLAKRQWRSTWCLLAPIPAGACMQHAKSGKARDIAASARPTRRLSKSKIIMTRDKCKAPKKRLGKSASLVPQPPPTMYSPHQYQL
ncbi:hypothetical protein E2C01_036950 [Portunus trituberculatus]|uniref:Uncharacterized protein n=1 Tax=Portunus trituberculatus TaxID=210409 RepID=A0A5B7FFR0_PORTR|nr:hypothetical protein [Portunus trituberculatus]